MKKKIKKKLGITVFLALILAVYSYAFCQSEKDTLKAQEGLEQISAESGKSGSPLESIEEISREAELIEEELNLEFTEGPLELTAEELEFEIPDDLDFIGLDEVPEAEEKKEEKLASKRVNLIFKEADVTGVLGALAQQTGVNIIWGEEVGGIVSLRMEDVPWEQALDMVLKANNLTYEKKENVIRVTTLTHLNEEKEALLKLAEAEKEKEPLITEIVVLNFSDAEEVQKSLEKVLSKRGSIVVDSRTNALVITEIGSNIEEVKRVAMAIDTQTPQVMIEARIVETSASFTQHLGVDWSIEGAKLLRTHWKGSALDPILDKLLGPETTEETTYTKTTPGAATDYTSTTTKTTVGGSVGDATIDETTTYTSNTPTESTVLTRTTSPESDERRAKRLEIEHKGARFDSKFSSSDVYDGETGYGGLFKLGILDAYGFEVAWQALQSDGDTKILSNPRVATLNNREAYIIVGEKIPIQKSEVTSEGTKYTVDYEDVGTKLKVTATINKEDMVTLRIQPEVSEIGEWVQLSVGQYPIINTKEADVEVLVKSGDTVVIGGMIYEKDTNTVAKIPFLGDIPLIGWAFKKKKIEKENQEILVFVTPTVFGKEEKERITKELMEFQQEDLELIEKEEEVRIEKEKKVFEEIEKELEAIEKEAVSQEEEPAAEPAQGKDEEIPQIKDLEKEGTEPSPAAETGIPAD